MHIITKKHLENFWIEHPESESPLRNWHKVAKTAVWKDLSEVKADFPHAERVGECTVFNVGGNNYRLIVKIKFRSKVLFVRFVLTHSEYDKDRWKIDCAKR